MSEILADCPHCGTSFSVSLAQLSVANGHVRCGVCMKVFKASDAPPQVSKTVLKPNPTQKIGNLDKDLDRYEDLDIETSVKKYQKSSATRIQSAAVKAPEGSISKESLRFEDDISELFVNLKPAPKVGSKEFTQAPEELVSVPAYAAKNDTAEDSLLGNFSDTHNKKLDAKRNLSKKQTEIEKDASSFGDDEFTGDFEDPFATHEEESMVDVVLSSSEIKDVKTLGSRLQDKKNWPVLSAIFSVILFSQVLIKNFDTLAINPSYRGFYSVFCNLGICTLPQLQKVESIRASNLIIRPHPSQQGALIIDAIINNKAPFAQVFPNLLLSFSNTQGKIIASREFKPDEYLKGELKGMTIMPSQSPLHLSMEIVDPGSEALSYQLDFVSGS